MSPLPSASPVTLVAHAKLTVALRVVGVRADGMHLLDAEMVALDLVDAIELWPDAGAESPTIHRRAGASRVTMIDADSGEPLPDLDSNLVDRALALSGRAAEVQVRKRIPTGAGLGGGSADAAAILRWADITDLDLAAQLGADVPFCLTGGRARVGGIGEQVDPLPFEPRTYTLLTPPFGCSTPAVYRRWDELGAPRDPRPGAGNDLEPAALDLEPRLVEWRDRLADATGREPRLAGSGSTWFVEGAFPGDGRVIAHTVPSTAADG
jgi:4-diphosphocytidyl-2-C-methyl-D-erythritol kinase